MTVLKKLTGFIGAEIEGLTLSETISGADAEFLKRSLAEYQVLVLRGQFLTPPEQKALTRAFGPALQLPYVAPLEKDPETIAVLKEASEAGGGVFGGEWHADFSFLANPPAGSVLNAIEIPEVGGDTVWASQTIAYDSLPAALKSVVDERRAVHVGKPYGVKFAPPAETRANASIRMTRGDPDADRETFHPAVITQPLTGRKALFLNPIYTTRLDGMTEEESQPILQEIYRHCTRPDFSCRHKWQPGDVVIWDNRTTLHYATNDYDGHRRLLYRTTFSGAAPV